jgi:hypothetical protein
MRHQDLQANHILESWVYANAAARTGATGFVAGDAGRVSFQQDTKQYWRLVDITPTWTLLGPSIFVRPTANWASFQDNTAHTIVSISPNWTMVGLNNQFTPQYSGVVLVSCVTTVASSVTNAFQWFYGSFGTGTPPVNKQVQVGTIFTNQANGVNQDVANSYTMGTVTGILSGLTIGTPYWFDITSAGNLAGATYSFFATIMNILEL